MEKKNQENRLPAIRDQGHPLGHLLAMSPHKSGNFCPFSSKRRSLYKTQLKIEEAPGKFRNHQRLFS
jgi:hypothetical protein